MEKLNKRQSNIIDILLNKSNFYTIQDIAHDLSCSYRTIYNDLLKVEKYIEKFDLSMIRKPRHGIKIFTNTYDLEKVRTILNKEQVQESTYIDERRNLIVFDLLNTDSALNINDIANDYYVSHSSIINDLDLINDKLNEFNIALNVKQAQVYVEGTELNKRDALFCLLTELIDEGHNNLINKFSNRLSEMISIDIDISESLNRIQNIILPYSRENNYNEPYLSDTILFVFITFFRNKLGYKLQSENELVKPFNDYEITNASLIDDILKGVSREFGFDLNSYENENLQRHFFSSGLSENEIELLKQKQELNKIDSLTIYFTDKLIENMSNLLNCDFNKKLSLKTLLRYHVKSLMNRLNFNIIISSSILKEIKENYEKEFLITKIAADLTVDSCKNVPYINDREIAYLVVYFMSALEDNNSSDINSILISSESNGVNNLIKTKIKNEIPKINIVSVIHPSKLSNFIFENIDYIISTTNLDINLPYKKISPLCTQVDLEGLSRDIEVNKNNNSNEKIDVPIRYIRNHSINSNKFYKYKDYKLYIEKFEENIINYSDSTIFLKYSSNKNLYDMLNLIFEKF